MQKFNVGDKVRHYNDGPEGEIGTVFAVAASGYYQIKWENSGKLLHHSDVLCLVKTEHTIESCLKFLTEQGFSVTLTKG